MGRRDTGWSAPVAAEEQWIVWQEDELAAEAEWALAELVAFTALPRDGGVPAADADHAPEARRSGAMTRG